MDMDTYGHIMLFLFMERFLACSLPLQSVKVLLLLSCAEQCPDSEAPSTAEVDLFMSTQRIKVLNADTQV